MILDDPKTFEDFRKRAAWGPWMLVGVLAILMGIMLLVVLVFERDPRSRFGPVSPDDKNGWLIAAAVVVLGAICIAPFWSRSLKILYTRGQRTTGHIVSMAALPKGGARLVHIGYEVEGQPFEIRRDLSREDIEKFTSNGVILLYDPEKPSRATILPPEIAALPPE